MSDDSYKEWGLALNDDNTVRQKHVFTKEIQPVGLWGYTNDGVVNAVSFITQNSKCVAAPKTASDAKTKKL